MADFATTKLSSKGQVVIPDNIRKQLNLKPGTQFLVIGEKDVVILKNISAPSLEEFDELISRARKAARKVGLKKTDIADTIATVRGRE